MRLHYRAYAAIALAVCLCLYAISIYFRRAVAAIPGHGDYYGAAIAVERFRGVRAALTPGTVLGYVTDLPPDNPMRQTVWATARYAIAPAVLAREPGDLPLLLGDLKRTGNAAEFLTRSGLRIERDFGRGVLLLRRVR